MPDTPDSASEPLVPLRMADIVPAPDPAPMGAPVATPIEGGERVGRYLLSELAAMRGRRGRKPPEFYTAFPELATAMPASDQPAKPAKAPRARVERLPQVSSAIIGDHTIDQLLAMIGTTVRKPVAYEILASAAQIFVEAGAVELPAPTDPLVRALGEASPAVRELVAELLRQAPAKRCRTSAPAVDSHRVAPEAG